MDALARHDMNVHRQTPPEKKLAEALDLMRAGIRLQRAKLRQQHPDDSDEGIDRRLRDWLQIDD